MTSVVYVARRSIIPGHSINTEYRIDLACLDVVPARTPNVTVNQAIGGRRETLRFFADNFFDVSLAALSGTPLLQVEEFLRSVEAGEVFTFDEYGSVNVPSNPVNAEIEGGGYSKTRNTSKGQGGANDSFNISFKVRVLDP
jgi:hypothetical protein